MITENNEKNTIALNGKSDFLAFGVNAAVILLCVALLVAYAVNAYAAVLNAKTLNEETRSTLSYIRNQVKNHDVADGIELRDEGGRLVLKEKNKDKVYELSIFVQGGYLVEEYREAGKPVISSEAVKLAPCTQFQADFVKADLLKIRTEKGELLIKLYSAG